ncbi:uncharacterized protein LOC132870362 isoform X2 [Neoarius graeffei]|uniref:uncharacterized protein LOC132870362 isoform X2 n=1 Tax=Neoarius graeffei TaxID=443677 RepID=UPI00298C27E9|nr:uncharacterized protein LOC132870362 isoform X2 [Neoarius graeffei]
MYWLFKDSPSHREDFTKVTGSNTFALKFCQHRWIENVDVCGRALSILPDVLRYVEAAKGRVISEPKCKSYEEVKKQASNNIFPVHVAIFSSIAKQVTPFMTAYQTDATMLPFMIGDMYKLIKGLMERFMKDTALKEATTMQKLLQISINNPSLHKDASKIDIWIPGRNINQTTQRL